MRTGFQRIDSHSSSRLIISALLELKCHHMIFIFVVSLLLFKILYWMLSNGEPQPEAILDTEIEIEPAS